MTPWFIALGVCLSSVPLAAQGTAPPPGVVEVDGAANPELIPEHVVWGTAFASLALFRDEHRARPGRGPLASLQLPHADAALVMAEVDRHAERRERCQNRGHAIARATRGAKERDAAMKAHTIECRWALLDAKDRLLASLTPEGRTSLTAWVLAERSKVKAYVRKEDLEFYRQPR